MKKSKNILSDCHVVISSDVLSQEIAGRKPLLDLRSEKYFGLDRSGNACLAVIEQADAAQ